MPVLDKMPAFMVNELAIGASNRRNPAAETLQRFTVGADGMIFFSV